MAFKVIETRYNGILFRSRLEARWAVFFDHLNIKWEYEHEGFNLEGVYYLPDFWLPDFDLGIYVECKPVEFNLSERNKANLLVLNTGKSLIKAIGTPKNKSYEFIYYDVCAGIGNTDFYHSYLA